MKKPTLWMSVMMSFLLVSLSAAQTTQPKSENAIDPAAIMRDAARAVSEVKSVQYEYEYWGEGVAFNLPRVIGTAKFERGPDRRHSRLRIYTEVGAPEGIKNKPKPRGMEIASDGLRVTGITRFQEHYFHGLIAEGAEIIIPSLGGNGTMAPFLEAEPFKRELADATLTLEGEADVDGEAGGVMCDVIRAVFPDDPSHYLWYIGREDRLPHRMDQVMANLGEDSRLNLKLTNLKTGVEFDPAIFHIEKPEGYMDRVVRSHYAIGAEAPDFTLTTSDGDSYHLADLRGRVVVVAIVASTHHLCKRIFPVLQELHEAYAEQPVTVLAISHSRLDRGDPAANMAQFGVTFPFLLHGEETAEAYYIRSLGSCFIIDANGKITYFEVANPETARQTLGDAIDQALSAIDGG